MQLKNSWPLPSFPKPIVIIGAGGIVNDAHMPAYRKANFDVLGLYDIDRKKSFILLRSGVLNHIHLWMD